ncbi:response regulator [Halovenus salina]|uniref:response regulator n=1 Tax=Halovenus salina TaxID=1510225 RepID=UPI003A8DBFA9
MTQSAGITISVLHVDDNPSFRELTVSLLEEADERFVVDTEASTADGMERLRRQEYDCVVSDYEMPGKDGIEFLRGVRTEYPDKPFILFTGKGSEEVASKAISAGVTDYLQKESGTEQYAVLANRITNAVDRYNAQRKLDQLRERTRELMYTETITETAEYAVEAANNIIGAPLSGVNIVNDAETCLKPVAAAESVPEVFGDAPVFNRDTPRGRPMRSPGRSSEQATPSASIRSRLRTV